MGKNVLWIMADQLRWDYLSCFGATHMNTPHLDRLAAKGVRFNKTYVQSPICGPSRMSFYTGRYVRSHGSTWNNVPLKIGEMTLGDHLREIGVKCSLVGKTHMTPDKEGMARLGIEPDSTIGALASECGFEVVLRDDGTNHTDYPHRHAEDYDAYLRAHGFDGDNPWEEWANSAEGENGELLTGWLLKNSHLPARVPAEHSETAWLTTRGIEFIEAQGDQPWLCHLSYIKPHWPYLAPAPYNDMYDPNDVPPVVRSDAERETDHPLMKAWLDSRICQSFSRDEVRDRVAPAYMGLIKQLDDEMGRLFDFLENTGRMDDTMIVFCSDHGDNMGDHWLGEKDLFYDCSARIPLIIYDPRPEADAQRGAITEALVEGIDLVPTFLEFFGGEAKPHIIEGRSLQAHLHGEAEIWRNFAFSEYDYSTREARLALGIDQADARLTMVFDGRWKLVHVEGFAPLLYDLEADPDELIDRASDPACAGELQRLEQAHFHWTRQHHTRTTVTGPVMDARAKGQEPHGIYIALWDEADLNALGKILPDKASG
ncbi:MAG: alkaline phosphatase family protein [Boseongicola sp.]|nr:alkaline phosphatase family protein [Boseongicola sp.]